MYFDKVREKIIYSMFYWRYIINFKSTFLYKFSKKKHSKFLNDITKKLRNDGIVITNYKELGYSEKEFSSLIKCVERKIDEDATRIKKNKLKQKNGFKSYQIEVFDNTISNREEELIKFFTSKKILDIVNKYFGMLVKLFYLNAWITFKSREQKNSQYWHRDPEDVCVIKIFVYMNDVNDKNGPFTYAPGTHVHGNIKKKPKVFMEKDTSARRSKDEDFEEIIPKNSWNIVTGKKGTIIIADTVGWHKGGFVEKGERRIIQAIFTGSQPRRKRILKLERNFRIDGYTYNNLIK